LTATADELVGRSMAASPDNRRLASNSEMGRTLLANSETAIWTAVLGSNPRS
jgi:hypothetical protein